VCQTRKCLALGAFVSVVGNERVNRFGEASSPQLVGSVGCDTFVFPPGENRHEASSS
jgi:hypothetical protein